MKEASEVYGIKSPSTAFDPQKQRIAEAKDRTPEFGLAPDVEKVETCLSSLHS